jgi:uncharacterized protein YdiU (UPF0061 family)
MNTDNMTVSGETIDYGPCAFMDHYDPATVFSSIDRGGRYAYGNQPHMARWNLARLAETLLPLLHAEKDRHARHRQPRPGARTFGERASDFSADPAQPGRWLPGSDQGPHDHRDRGE